MCTNIDIALVTTPLVQFCWQFRRRCDRDCAVTFTLGVLAQGSNAEVVGLFLKLLVIVGAWMHLHYLGDIEASVDVRMC